MLPELSGDDSALLHGEGGPGAAFATQILVTFAGAVGARKLLAIHRAHIDGCLYHGRVNLDFVERLVAGGARVRVPTTLNVGAVDLIHPELVRLDRDDYAAGRRLMTAHEALGCEPSFTCAPYHQARFRPGFGQQIAWGESNAIVFANSVIGARTNRYADFIDLCCAVTGRAPAWGLHLDENRRGEALFRLTGFPSSLSWSDSLAVGVGLFVGSHSGDRVPVIEGLPTAAETGVLEDYLKALGAAAASSGAVALFHAVGITPEAPTLADALGGMPANVTIDLTPDDLANTTRRLSTVEEGAPLTAVCLGTPHFSRREWDRLLPALRLAPRSAVPIYVNTGRAILQDLERDGALDDAEGLNLIVVADTCTYLTPILKALDGVVMTNSGKWAYYGPGNLGVRVAFGDLADCLASAIVGRVVRSRV